MKTSGLKLEMQRHAAEALRSLLTQVSTIKLKEIREELPSRNMKASFVALIDVFGHPRALACHVTSSTERTDLRALLQGLSDDAAQLLPEATPVLIAPYLPPEAQAICKELKASFFDFEGNARLHVDEVFIVRRNLTPRNASLPLAPAFDSVMASCRQESAAGSDFPRGAGANHHNRHSTGAIAVA
jgi:hypothetical protein